MKLDLILVVGGGAGYGLFIETGTDEISIDKNVELIAQGCDGVKPLGLQNGSKYCLSKLIKILVEKSNEYPDGAEFKIRPVRKKDEGWYMRHYKEK